VRDIIAISLAAHVLTRSTAFVAVDDHPAAAGRAARRVVVPADIPEATGGYGYMSAGTYGTIGYGYGAGGGTGGMQSRTAAVPQIVIGEAIALGSLDASIVRRYIKRQIEKVRYCYEKQLAAHPTLTGTVTAHVVIDEDGHVVRSTADGMDDTVAACVAGVLGAIEFPKAEGAGTTQVNYPFTFEPNVIRESVVP
jgi:hypothetical protein